ncbi:unnamed protein product [Candidula unifasciata]|uniref:J domain-containing protein n=1 Tax=Candidula unifasciata TaxID=100452 RepID=A0A8S3Z7N9_9EUPU|nr:unnamed protein product [Candidula unifasciata]
MPLLIDSCKEFFQTTNLYEVLGVTKEASKQEVKKGYYKKSLAYHPDRVSDTDKDVATKKFQVLSQIYNILSDDGRRAEYDETGSVGEEVILDENMDWQQYWRLHFRKVSIKDIEEFSQKYKGSSDELEDLKSVYLSSEGDLENIMNTMLCSSYEDEPRFVKILTDLIKEGTLPDFPAFSKESKKKKAARMQKARAEAKEAAEEAKKLKLDDTQESLASAIQQRQASRAAQADNFFSQLEAKYGGASKTKKKASKKSK